MLISIENLLNSPINLIEDQYAIPSSLLVEPNNSQFSFCEINCSEKDLPINSSNPVDMEIMDQLYDLMILKAPQAKSKKKSKPNLCPKKKYTKKNK